VSFTGLFHFDFDRSASSQRLPARAQNPGSRQSSEQHYGHGGDVIIMTSGYAGEIGASADVK
jgi:hypothetical protein